MVVITGFEQWVTGDSYFAIIKLAFGSIVYLRLGVTYSIPCVDGVSSSLAAVLHMSNLGQTSTGNTEHLHGR